ncbi:MAG: hypothetical protein ACKO0Z_04615, partial [Betaproteobacteria bacterium]
DIRPMRNARAAYLDERISMMEAPELAVFVDYMLTKHGEERLSGYLVEVIAWDGIERRVYGCFFQSDEFADARRAALDYAFKQVVRASYACDVVMAA